MSNQDIIDTIAAAAHPWENYVADDGNKSVRSLESPAIAANVFAALSERYAIVPRPEPPIGGYEHIVESGKKRYAIVELPEPEYGPDGGGQYGWTSPVAPVSTCDGRVWEEDCDMEPHEAQEHAAALLAAADKAEEGK